MTDVNRQDGCTADLALADFFPLKVCINLDKRGDRWQRVRARFEALGITGVVRFSALDGSELEAPRDWQEEPGAYGCLRSHLAVVEEARRIGAPSVLIFEDDVVLHPVLKAEFARHISRVPSDWDMLMFGGIHRDPPVKVSDNIARVSRSSSTFAYALKHTIYDRFIASNSAARMAVDDNNAYLQNEFNCYCFYPHLAWVEEDYSDVRHERRSHWYVKESLVLWGPRMDAIFKDTALILRHSGDSLHALRNLGFIVSHYMEKLPGIEVMIVEQNPAQRLDPRRLPTNCRYQFTRDSGSKGVAFNTGVRALESARNSFIFSDRDIFIDPIDIKPNLLMCERFGFATSFRNLFDLTEADTLRCLTGDLGWRYLNDRDSSEKTLLSSFCCMFTSDGLAAVGPWKEDGPGADEEMSARIRARLGSFYESPNPARRFWS